METSLGRHDQEALACYALGPFGAVLLLVYETENDFVRFHAFQVRRRSSWRKEA